MYLTKGKRILKLLLLLVLIIAIFILIRMDMKDKNYYDRYYLYAKVNGEKINLFEQDNEYYLFLPSYADENDVKYSKAAENTDVHVLKSENLPALFVDTQSGNLEKIYADKNYKESGKLRVYSSKGEEEYEGGVKALHGHGNYSWYSENWDKKPFSLILNNRADICGIDDCSKYTLIANASDPTMIINDIGRQLDALAGVEFTHRGQFVDLYVNGDYQGCYYLCDNIDIDESRIDVNNLEEDISKLYRKSRLSALEVYEDKSVKCRVFPVEPEDYTGGYLFEREFADRYKLEYEEAGSGFTTNRGENFILKSPEYISEKEMKYLSNYINEMEDAIYSEDGINSYTGKSYMEYLNIESFAARYIVEELMNNYDAGTSSMYFYKDSDKGDGRICLAQGWDYDMSLGNYQSWMKNGILANDINMLWHDEDSSLWYQKLYMKPEFQKAVRDCFNEKISNGIREVYDGIYDQREYLKSSQRMDSIRWKAMYAKCGYLSDNSGYFDAIREYIISRYDCLDEYLNNQ